MMRVFLIVLVSLVAIAQPTYAQLTIEITQGVDNPISIAVVPFGWEGAFTAAAPGGGRIMSSLARHGGLAGPGGIAGQGGGLAA